MKNPFKWKKTISPNLIAILIIGIAIGFFAGLVASGGFYETGPPVFAISDGEKTTYLELYEGEKATITFLTGEQMSIGNIDGTNLFIDSGGKGVTSITEEELSKEEAENLVGEAWIKPWWLWIPRIPQIKCTDSDGGKNYYVKGTAERGTIRRTDFCLADGERLREYYCKNNRIKSKIYDCSKEGKVCEDGACVKGCAKEGEQFSKVYKELPEHCCEGLKEWPSGMDTRISVADVCYETAMYGGAPVGTCINCGNNVCEDIENPCNCPEDCVGKGKSTYKTVKEFCEQGFEKYCSGPRNIDLLLCQLCKDARLTLSTLKDEYSVGERVDLTDPPSKNIKEEMRERQVTTRPTGAVNKPRKYVPSVIPAKQNLPTEIFYSKGLDEAIKTVDYDEFSVPEAKGYIVQFKEKPMLKKRSEIRRTLRAQALRTHKSRILSEHRGFKRDIPTLLGKSIDRIKILGEYTNAFNGMALDISPEEAEKIKTNRYVKNVYPNRKVETTLMDSVPLINADDVWNLGYTGENVTIAIIDTGIDYTHTDFGSCNPRIIQGDTEDYSLESPHPYENDYDHTWTITMPGFTNIAVHFTNISVESGWDYVYILDANDNIVQTITGTYTDFWSNSVDGNTIKIRLVSDYSITDWGFAIDKVLDGTVEFDLGLCDKVIGGYDFVNDDEDPMDDHGHGTHVAGIAASNGNLKGVAPGAKLHAYKVLSGGGWGYWDWVIAGIERAVDPNDDGDFSDHVDVISMSLGGWGNPDDPVSQAVDNAVDSGVVAVIAAGNSGPSEQTIGSPGTARKAITVGATYKSDYVVWFSSRGPVIWENGAIIKPDVVAPGVYICAAQWDAAWNDRKCFDDEHVAISGTSMATPHVSGVVALLKQKNPDWGPEEIKMALRKTAKDLGYDINTQGYGRIDALEAIELVHKPCIASISTSGEVSGLVDIKGSAYCDEFGSYTLYFEETELHTSTDQVTDGNLYSGFDATELDDGQYILKLVVRNIYGEEYEDNVLLIINNSFISGIGDTLNYIKGNELVRGGINIQYDAYKIDYRKESETEWHQICYETSRLSGDVLCSINVGSFENGVYYFRLSVLKNNKWLHDVPFRAAVIQEMLDNWPIELMRSPEGVEVVEDIDNDVSRELLLPHYRRCEDGWCSDRGFYIFEKDGSFKFLDKLYKDSSTSMISDWFPSVYYDKETNENLIALADYSKLGLVDYEGNFMFDWPYSLPYKTDPIVPFVISDLGKGEEENKLFISAFNYTADRDRVIIFGFDKQGNALENFPIKVSKEENLDNTVVLRGLSFLQKDEEPRIGIVAGDYYWDNGKHLKFYLDIYSQQGNLIKRTYLFDDVSRGVLLDLSFSATGDLNNDGNTEIVIGFSIIDYDLFREDVYNIEAYKTYIYVIDSDGNIISKPFEIKGYTIQNIALGNLGRDKLDIVISLWDTWPTTYNGQKIVAFDYLGNSLFDINLSDYNDLIQGLVVGDVDGDDESEVVINYRPRWYERNPSGIQIYNKAGVLDKEIEIPTFGEVDDYWGFYPTLSDFNNDGKVDVVLQSLFWTLNFMDTRTRLYALDLNSEYDENKMEWPMILHDPQHTGLYTKPGPKSKSQILNKDKNGILGYLTMKVEKHDGTNWVEYRKVVNKLRKTVPGEGHLALDTIWADYGSFTPTESGNYRVYAEFTDKNGNVIRTKTGLLKDSWEFRVT